MLDSLDIVDYIRACFKSFSLDMKEFFYYDFGDGLEEITWLDDDGELIPGVVELSSEILGISTENITSCKEDAVIRRLNQYPYFRCVEGFEREHAKTYYGDNHESVNALMKAIFGNDDDTASLLRYDYKGIRNRMISILEEMDEVMPGTIHKGAKIRKVWIDTENFFHYKHIRIMTESYIEMIQKTKELFVQAVNLGLSRGEILEYNFLVTVMGLQDRYYPRGYLYYSNIEAVREVYEGVSKDTVWDYITLKRLWNFQPWKCADFVNDEDLVERYLTVVPEAKGLMREYAMQATCFKCTYIWSDAGPADSQETIEFCNEVYQAMGEETVSTDEWCRESEVVYVKKTKEELNGDDETAERLRQYCRPAKRGGIRINIPSVLNDEEQSEFINRVSSLLGRIKPNSIVERRSQERSRVGGSANE